MNTPMFKTDCPSCGAPVAARSATSITLVCNYCKSLLLRQDDTLVDSGRDSALLTDFSPLQLGTVGTIGDVHFTLIGRLQAQYDAGMWNEWYLAFDDGGTGWLSEAGDVYVLLRPAASPADAPDFEDIRAGQSTLKYQDKHFLASDVREITLRRVAAEGELPFVLEERMHNRVSDWRAEAYFLTLDYGETPPQAFLGYGVALEALNLQHGRTDEQIIASAGKLKGTREAQNCPHCGSPVEWIVGVTPGLVCPSCASTLDVSADKAVVLEAGDARQQQQRHFTLKLGATATIHDKPYTLIGALYKDEVGEATGWAEYLLYHPQAGFLWLVHTDAGEWSLARTLNRWPRLDRRGHPQGCEKLFDYQSTVRFAIGAFYWHVRHGDHSFHRDYRQGKNKLCAEISAQEMSWSENIPVSAAQVEQWFGLMPASARRHGGKRDNSTLSWFMIALFCLLNVPAWLAMDSDNMATSIVISLIAVFMLHKLGHGSDDTGGK